MRAGTTTTKLLLSIGALGTAAAMAGLGTFATFTSSTSASEPISSGTVSITLGVAGSADNRLTIGATGLVPGDSIQRRVKLSNAPGNESLASIELTTTAPVTSSVLDTDATNGLGMKIEKCGGTLGWRESASTPYTYTCDSLAGGDDLGARSTVLARRAVIGADLALSGMSALAAGSTDDMVVTLDLPVAAGNGFQTQSSTILYTFDAVQRDGGAK